MKKNLPPFFILLILVLAPFSRAIACHGVALANVNFSLNASDLTINADSDPATCGCGPYYLEAEVVPASSSYNSSVPPASSSAWGSAPWFHSILNIPGYGPPNWSDNCVTEPYTPLVIPFASLCSGMNYKVRLREHATGGGTPGPWTTSYTFTTPGSAASAVLNPLASPDTICIGGFTWIDAFGGACSGSGTYSWSPAIGLSNPNSPGSTATPTVTTTYTMTFFDANLSMTFIDSVTVVVVAPLVITGSIVEASCGQNNGTITLSVSGGTSPYAYYWSWSGNNTNVQSGISTSSYDVTVTDAMGCVQSDTFLILDSCNLVWPGDANDDSLADNFDLLDIAIANGTYGTTRPNASVIWNGYPSQDWADTLANGANYKSVDCNGDGVIDLNDTAAVLLNFGQYHLFRQHAPVYNSTLPDLSVQFMQDSVASGGAIGIGQINLGSQSVQATNVYGLAFTISFDPSQIDILNTSAYPVQGWLGNPGTDVFGADHIDTNGQVAVAFARFNQTNATGGGPVGAIYFRTTSALNGTGNAVLVPFTISNVKVISADESIIQVNAVNDSVTVYDVQTGIQSAAAPGNLNIYPNPNNGTFNLSFYSANTSDCRIEILNTLGQTVYSEELKQVNGYYQKSIQLPQAAQGIYLVRISNAQGQTSSRIHCR